MYVRLAFAVAAHLEPEILIVDEVLAVGDADFQKKCLGKMSDVASHGRTVIFVSHNMQAVQSLCKSALYLKNGKMEDSGLTNDVVNNYLSKEVRNCLSRKWDKDNPAGNSFVELISADVLPRLKNDVDNITVKSPIDIRFEFVSNTDALINLSLHLYSSTGVCIFNVGTNPTPLKKGQRCVSRLEIPGDLLNDDIYSVNLMFVKDTSVILFSMDDLLTFEVFDDQREGNWFGKWPGAIRPTLNFTLT